MDDRLLDNAFKEAFSVLLLLEEDIFRLIPDNVMNSILERASRADVEPHIDLTKGIFEQNISEEGKDILSIIYYSFVCNDNEKKILLDKWINN